MNNAILRKAAALACSIATLSVLGITASAQTPLPDDKDIDSMTDLVDGKVNIVAGVIEAQPGEIVTFPVYLANNAESGYSAAGLRLIYDDNLTPCTGKDGAMIINKKCTASDDVVKTFSLNYEKNIIGLGTMGVDPEKDNGLLYTVDIKVPSSAKAGDIFTMNLEVDKFLDAETNPLEVVTFDGCIFIGGQAEQPAEPTEPTKPEEPKEPKDPKGHKEHKDHKDKKGKKDKKDHSSNSGNHYGWYHSSHSAHYYWYEAGRWHVSTRSPRR